MKQRPMKPTPDVTTPDETTPNETTPNETTPDVPCTGIRAIPPIKKTNRRNQMIAPVYPGRVITQPY
ncbi:MAG: hypothetical protein WCR52_12100 [Bacteroidota bacterium]